MRPPKDKTLFFHDASLLRNPAATILPAAGVQKFRPAPVIAHFSSRGPGELTESILKPDIAAPGVAILAAVVPKAMPGIGKEPSGYALLSGTSMACPHVSGIATFIKSVRPKWTTSMIKSALMTAATTFDNLRSLMTNSSGHPTNPYEMGAGEINPLKALNPGLVFKTTRDYLKFLCYYGTPEKSIRALSKTNFICPTMTSENRISSINYPSISISKLDRRGGVRTIKSTATNIGSPKLHLHQYCEFPLGISHQSLAPEERYLPTVRTLLLVTISDP